MSSGGNKGIWRALLVALVEILRLVSKQNQQQSPEQHAQPHSRGEKRPNATWRGQTEVQPKPEARQQPRSGSAQASRGEYEGSPGQFGDDATRDLTPDEIRRLRPQYSAKRDGEPDPGEVVWTWVPFVEYNGEGKDRPVLLIATLEPGAWAACYLSTKHHQDFVPIGSGAWDSQGRESFLSPERVLRVTEGGMRRESGGVERRHFDRAIAAIREYQGF